MFWMLMALGKAKIRGEARAGALFCCARELLDSFSRKQSIFLRMKTRWGVAAVVAGLLAGGLLTAQSSSQSSLLILSKRGHTLAIVDPSSLKVLAKVPTGDDPHEVIASADGRTAWVSNYGGGSLHTLAVVDLVGQKAMPAVDLEP